MPHIKLIGVGGVGTNLLCFLPRYLAYQAKGDTVLILLDGDSFEAPNLARQHFSVPGNKAQVKAAELREEFPHLTVLAKPEFVTQENVGQLIQEGDIVLLAVDNHATRLLVSRHCQGLAAATLISAGNDADLATGNCQVYIRENRKDLTVPIERYHPEIQSPKDRNPGEDPDCQLEAQQGSPQIVVANMAAALCMAMCLYQVLEGIRPAGEMFFDIRTGEIRTRERGTR